MCESMQHPSEAWLYGILISYLVFAGQILYQTRWAHADARSATALMSLILVFLFCALAHFSGKFPASMWDVREGIYIMLLSVTNILIWTNQAAVISKLIEKEFLPVVPTD